MPIDPDIQALLQGMAAANLPPLETLAPEAARAFERQLSAMGDFRPDIWQVSDLLIDGGEAALPARLYRAVERCRALVVFFHAGGWVIGDLDSADAQLRWLAARTDCAILSVAYRLAPEHRFPAAADDACAALSWAQAHTEQLAGGDVRLVVAGESAGANLAAVAAIAARDAGGPPLAAQILLYPVTDSSFDYASYRQCADGPLLTRKGMGWFWDLYAPDAAQRLDPRAAPLRTGSFAGLPPTLIQTAEFDPLRDEGEAYGLKLAEAGVDATVQRRAGLIHGYAGMIAAAPAAMQALQDVAVFLLEHSRD